MKRVNNKIDWLITKKVKCIYDNIKPISYVCSSSNNKTVLITVKIIIGPLHYIGISGKFVPILKEN